MVVSSSRPMAKSEVTESEGASGGAKSDWDTLRRSILRRRPSVGGLFDDSSLQRDIPEEDTVTDSSSKDFVAAAKSGEEDKDRVKVDNVGVKANREKDVDVSSLKFLYRPSVPVHRTVKESPLSSDKIFNQSHAGLLNLCIVVLVAVNSRLIIENLMKYGLLIKYGFWFSSKSLRDWPLFMCCLTLAVFPIASYLVEILAERKQISEPAIISLHIFITTAAVLYPVSVILRCNSAFLSGVTLMLLACIVWLKLVSYAHTNSDLRSLRKSIEKGEDPPNNLKMEYSYTVNFKSLVYFMVAPTLCYQ